MARWRKAAQDANAQPLLTMADQKDLQKRHQEGQRQRRHLSWQSPNKNREESQSKEAELFQQIGRLQMEVE